MNKKRQYLCLIIAISIMGFSGMVAQVLLLRELLVAFYGNELTIGVILANWVILEAIGAFFLGRFAEGIKKKLEAYVFIQIIFSVSFPAAIYLTRILKQLLGVEPGLGLGLMPIMYSSFILLLPVSVSHGALFTFGSKLYGSLRGIQGRTKDASSIGMVYVYETLGTIAGGIVFTYLLIPYLHSFLIALVIFLLNLFICLLLLGGFWRKGAGTLARGLVFFILVLLITGVFSVPFKWADRLQQSSVEKQWQGQNIVHYQNSIYNNIVVTKREEQWTFYSNGIPIVTAPTPDIAFVEEFAHFPMLFHPEPKEILVISAGAGGLINELLKHPVERIDYVELDPLIIELVRKYKTPMTEAELSDVRVHIENLDGRLFVRQTKRLYDVILIGLSNPTDLQTNRLFTADFFNLARKRLKEGGIFAVTLPGSLVYLGQELKELNASVLNTLRRSFNSIRVIPGDTNLFLCSDSKSISEVKPDLLIERITERRLSLRLFTQVYINYRMDQGQLDWFFKSIKQTKGNINRDFLPLGVFYNLAYWNAQFSPYLAWLFRGLMRADLRVLFSVVFIFTAALLFPVFRMRRFSHLTVPFCLVTSGFAGMILDLVLIFSFQILYGYVYYQIGLLVTAFMAGTALGGLVMTRFLERLKNDLRAFINLELGVILVCIILPLVIFFFSAHPDLLGVSALFALAFLILCLLAGLVVGLQFPLACRIYLKASPGLSHTAGLVYGADLFGGWIGGIIGGVVLLPLLGLAGTCAVLVAVKFLSLSLLLITPRQWAGD